MAVRKGDIVPASDAMVLMEVVDLSPSIPVPEIPADVHPENISPERRAFLVAEITRLKREKNALVLAHNYMPPDVQDVADVVGDSLHLARVGSESNADILCEAAVLFMNQILAIRKKPHQTVLAPSLDALCSLAAHADVRKIQEWKRAHPNGIVISYVNTYVEVKAESHYCCASANSAQVIKYVLGHHPEVPILFLPDVYLGFYAAKLLEKEGESLDRLWLMMGACHVHDRIRPEHVFEQMERHPDAAVVIHPECGCTSACMTRMAARVNPEEELAFRSTQGMVDYARGVPNQEIIVATEVGNIHPMQKAVPGKTFIPASREAVCAFMKQNTLEKLYVSLRDEKHVITVDPQLAARAWDPIQKMLEIT